MPRTLEKYEVGGNCTLMGLFWGDRDICIVLPPWLQPHNHRHVSVRRRVSNIYLAIFCNLILNHTSKYGLGTAAQMLRAHGKRQGAGLDIGCSHMKTLFNSALGPLARQLEHTVLVDVFHGNAHNRLCQLSNLTHYVDGLGLEALDVCKQAFSKSNALARSTRSMSRFHRQQAITAHFRDTENYENFMTFSKCSIYGFSSYKTNFCTFC